MNKKGHILVNLGQLKHETPLNYMQTFGMWKYRKKIKKDIACWYQTQKVSIISHAFHLFSVWVGSGGDWYSKENWIQGL